MKKRQLMAAALSIGLLTTACTGNSSQTSRNTEPNAATGTETGSESGSETIGSGPDSVGGEITVSCYDSATYRTFLEEAAKLFEEQYPGTKVNIDCFSEMPEVKTFEQDGTYVSAIMQEDDPQGRADYISKISTALMSGQGADLLAMDVLPLRKYVESGQLENLADYMERDPEFQKSDYRENIFNSAVFNNGTWFLPLDYTFDYYTYDSTLLSETQRSEYGTDRMLTSGQLMDAGKAIFDGENKIFSTPSYTQEGGESLFTRMFKENYGHYVDMESKSAQFEDGEFKSLLNTVKELADDGYIPKGVNQAASLEEMMTTSSMGNPTNRFLFKAKDNFSLIMDTYPDSTGMMLTTSNAETGIEADDQIAGVGADEAGSVPFAYQQAYGINSDSQNKDTAWAFLKFLLSHDVQASPSLSLVSLPVHNAARQEKSELLYSMLLTGGGALDETQREALASYTDMVEVMSDRINGYSMIDTTIQDMVMQETAYFFDGTKTADDVCRALQNKVGLYLNE